MYYCPQCNEFKTNYYVNEEVFQTSSCIMKEDGFEEIGEVMDIIESRVDNRYCQECGDKLTWGVLDWIKSSGETVHRLYTDEQLIKIRDIMFSKGLTRLVNDEILICKVLI